MAPGMQPVVRRPGVMLRRWSISVGLGAESMHAKQPVNSPTVGFATFELAGRFRIVPAVELGLSLGGGGAFEGKFSSGKLAIDFHYRFLAEQLMNVYALASLGVGSVYRKDNATDAERKGRGMLQIGAGGELRFDALALTAELRLFGIGENPDVPEAIPSTTAYELSRYGVSGAALVLGATYYF